MLSMREHVVTRVLTIKHLLEELSTMTPYRKRRNKFVQRMADDLKLRNYSANTIDTYTWHVTKFCEYFGKPPERLGPKHIREYQLFLVNEKKASWSSFNQAVCSLRFLYETTLGKPWAVKHIPFGKRPKKLPIVLSGEEAKRLLECFHNAKHRAVLLTCYAAGLRLTEATHLKVADIDGSRNQLRITNGKGAKERVVPASPRLLQELREYWTLDRPKNYLFPGKTPDVPLSSATIQKAMKLAVAEARITKDATPHTLRHSWATGMLEAGVDLLTISKLLGHSSFITTMIYLHVRQQHFDRAPSPIDFLPVRQCPQWADPSTGTPLQTPPQPPSTDSSLTTTAGSPNELAGGNDANSDSHESDAEQSSEAKRPIRRKSGRKPRKNRRGRRPE